MEPFFSKLARQVLARGRFDSAEALAAHVVDFIQAHDQTATPFAWRYDARGHRDTQPVTTNTASQH